MFKLDLENQRSNFQHLLNHRKSKRVPEKHPLLLHWLCKAFDCVDHNKLENSYRIFGNTDHLTCLLRNLYAGQEAAVRTRHGTMNWFQIGKWTGFKLGKTHQGCILSPCLLKYIMQNAGLDNVKTGIKIARRNINNLIYEHDTTFMAESEEKLKSFLIKWKRRMKKLAENSTFGKVRS